MVLSLLAIFDNDSNRIYAWKCAQIEYMRFDNFKVIIVKIFVAFLTMRCAS